MYICTWLHICFLKHFYLDVPVAYASGNCLPLAPRKAFMRKCHRFEGRLKAPQLQRLCKYKNMLHAYIFTYIIVYTYIIMHIYIYVCVFVWVYNRRVLFVQYCLYVYTHVTMYDCMGIWSGDMWEYFTAMKQEVWWLWWNSKCFLDGSFLIQWLTFPIQNLESKIPQSKLGPIKAANFKIVCSTFDVSMAQTCSNGLDHLDHMKQLRNSLLMPLESRMWFQAILEGTEHPSKSFGLFEASIST